MKFANFSRKSQLTIFIIVGMVILLIFILLFYVIKSTNQSSQNKEIEQAFRNALNERPFKNYITSCLQRSFQEGAILLGRQGGVIYKDQGSLINRSIKNIKINNYDTSYLISPVPLDPPYYPCFNDSNPPKYCGFINNPLKFPDVYSGRYRFGLNQLLLLDYGKNTIKEQLESFIANKTKECVGELDSHIDLPTLVGYNIIEGEIIPKISFESVETSVKINFQ